MKRHLKWLFAAILFLPALLPSYLWGQTCGGRERWAVKVGTDPRASGIDLSSRTPISLQDLISLPQPKLPPRNDNTTRLEPETHVYAVAARLVQFKFETDNDYHLVVTDDTLNFTSGGSAPPSGHSFVAEIPDPNCIAGAQGSSSAQSLFIDGIRNARSEIEAQFPNIDRSGKFNDAGGIPVQIVGVGFFDFAHRQVGRAPNNIEIHPVLDIVFNPSSATWSLSAFPTQLSVMPGATGTSVITTTVSGGLNGAITLSVSGTPPGANATLSPTFIPAPGAGSSTLSITSDAWTPVGNYSLTVSGSGGGVTQTTTIPLTVVPATAGPPLTTAVFPWPPPKWSLKYPIPDVLVLRSDGKRATMGEALERLKRAMAQAEIDQWSVYPIPNAGGDHGFVVVSRPENIGDDGRWRSPRFCIEDCRLEEISLGAVFKALFSANAGRYRVIALVVTDLPIQPGSAPPTPAEMERIVTQGPSKLPPEMVTKTVNPTVTCEALIYEFYRPNPDAAPQPVDPSSLTAIQHLTGAGLWRKEDLER